MACNNSSFIEIEFRIVSINQSSLRAMFHPRSNPSRVTTVNLDGLPRLDKTIRGSQWRCVCFSHLNQHLVIASDASPAKQSKPCHYSELRWIATPRQNHSRLAMATFMTWPKAKLSVLYGLYAPTDTCQSVRA